MAKLHCLQQNLLKELGLILLFLTIVGCNSSSLPDTSNIKVNTKFKRFDEAFFITDTAEEKFYTQLNALKIDYPHFFMSNETDRFFYLQRNSELPQNLYKEVSAKLETMTLLNENLNRAFKFYYYYYGTKKTITPYTYISNLDFDYPIILADSVLFVASDMYLGVSNPFYQNIPSYQAYYRQPAFMVRDIMEALALSHINKPEKERLLDDMIFNGKCMYFVAQLMPDAPIQIITKYSEKHLNFASTNEKSIWAYFIENNLLFDTSMETKRRFIELAPFSKFYTKLDNESPGMIGKWVGYQIVTDYMENSETTLKELMQEADADKILRKSNYKP